MLLMTLKVILTSALIVFSSWLANKKPGVAGFIIALPLSSMIAIALNYTAFKDAEKSSEFARSILVAVPLSLTFFIPFLISEKLKLSFPWLYGSGFVLLSISYFAHRWITK